MTIAGSPDQKLNRRLRLGMVGGGRGAFIGAVLCWLAYRQHFDAHDVPGEKLAVFSTGPQIRSPLWNTVTEVIGTFLLVYTILQLGTTPTEIGPLAVALLVVGIGASLGGPTRYAINPARDLGPRLAHAVEPQLLQQGIMRRRVERLAGEEVGLAGVAAFGELARHRRGDRMGPAHACGLRLPPPGRERRRGRGEEEKPEETGLGEVHGSAVTLAPAARKGRRRKPAPAHRSGGNTSW